MRPPRRPSAPFVLLAAAAVAATGWIDYLTGPELAFSLFYLVPVAAAGWWLGPRVGVALAVAAGIAWVLADTAWHPPSHLPISAWNGFTRLVIFVLCALATSRLRDDREQLVSLNERLRELLQREQALARTDSLTGLANVRAFHERLASELPRIRRRHDRLCLAAIDVDNFKLVNDRFGHAGGDALLCRMAMLLRATVRAGDEVARIGGDEFAIALWESEPGSAERLAASVVRGIEEMRSQYPGVPLGASVGIAHFAEPPTSVEDALLRADVALYAAKAAGKGAIAVCRDDGVPLVRAFAAAEAKA